MTRRASIALACLLCAVEMTAQGVGPASSPTTPADAARLAEANDALANLPGEFTENRGQWAEQARFLMKRSGLNLWITDRGAVYDLHHVESESPAASTSILSSSVEKEIETPSTRTIRGHVLGLAFENVAPTSRAVGMNDIGRRTNYFVGARETWGADCRSYESVRLQGIYAGIDALFYLDDGLPRYDIHVAPGADASAIRFRLEGADEVRVTREGRLAIGTSLGEVELRELYAYQEMDGGVQRQVACAFVVDAEGVISFRLGAYDHDRALVIDPLLYSTFIGGAGDDRAHAIVVDGSGTAWLTGQTFDDATTDYPTTTGAYDATHAGNQDVFISAIDPSAGLTYSTFIGGNALDAGFDILLDGDGNVWVTGRTGGGSTPYPTAGAYDATSNGSIDLFVTQIDPTAGTGGLLYSTFIGGSSAELAQAIALDASGNVWVTGYTDGGTTLYPTTANAYDGSHNTGSDVFVTQLDPTAGTAGLLYSTFIGGDGVDSATGILLDADGNVWITGKSNDGTTDYPTTANAYDGTHNGGSDIFVTQLDPTAGTAGLLYSTYVGGSGFDVAHDIVMDGSDNIWITGSGSTAYPTTAGAYDATLGATVDAVVTQLDPTAGTSGLLYSTFVGGSGFDIATALALDPDGNVWITGSTNNTSFPTTVDAYDASLNGGFDVYIAQLDPTAGTSGLLYSTFIGGLANDFANEIALDGGDLWVAGFTAGGTTPYPTTSGAHDEILNGGNDVIVSKLQPFPCTEGGSLDITLTPEVIWPGSTPVTVTATLDLSGGCAPAATLQSITADEDITGDVTNATFGTADLAFDLAAERDPSGDGRVYTVTYRVTDGATTTDFTAKVVVPFNQGTIVPGGASTCGAITLGAIPTYVSGTISIPYTIGGSGGTVRLRVLDTRGKEVARLVNNATIAAGSHTASFDGVKSIGSFPGGPLPDGTYLVVLEACGATAVGVMEIDRP